MACDRGDHWWPDQPEPLGFGQILRLPAVEQVVDDRKQTFFGGIPRLGEVVIEVRVVDRLDRRVDIRVRRQEHAAGQRIRLAGLCEEIGSVHPRHPLVADHDRQRIPSRLELADRGEGFFA